jgi:parvulin-like peptidyl-prolyl isomerase
MVRPIRTLLLLTTLTGAPIHAQTLRAAAHPEAAAASVATVNGVAIAHAQFDAALRQAVAAGAKDSPEMRSALKSQLIARELLRQAAQAQRLADDPDVQAAVKQAQEAAMLQKYLRNTVKPSPITEAQIKDHYDKVVASLGAQEYKARIILVANEASAKSLLAQLNGGKTFAELAQLHSAAPSANAGGALDWVSFKIPVKEGATQNFPLPLAQSLVKLHPGMVHGEPIQWNGAYYLLKLDENRATQIPAYEQVKPALARALTQKEVERASAALMANLLKNAKISQ